MRGLLATASIALIAAMPAMQLHSSDFSDGGTIPRWAMAPGCGGQNRSPALAWNAAAKETKSFALIVVDPDSGSPMGVVSSLDVARTLVWGVRPSNKPVAA